MLEMLMWHGDLAIYMGTVVVKSFDQTSRACHMSVIRVKP